MLAIKRHNQNILKVWNGYGTHFLLSFLMTDMTGCRKTKSLLSQLKNYMTLLEPIYPQRLVY
jgi:hypothetical protein